MKLDVKVKEVMTRNPIIVEPGSRLIDCVREMRKKRMGSIIIKGNPFRIITEKDILTALIGKKDPNRIKIGGIAGKKAVSITPSADLYDAFRKMNKKRVAGLIVLENKKIVGILRIGDIVRVEPSLFEKVIQRVREDSQIIL